MTSDKCDVNKFIDDWNGCNKRLFWLRSSPGRGDPAGGRGGGRGKGDQPYLQMYKNVFQLIKKFTHDYK